MQAHLRRGICGKGSTKRPGRPQIEQRSQRLGRFSNSPGSLDGSEAATGIVIVPPQPNGVRRNDRKGTLIRHASRRVTPPVLTLPVAMIEPALETPLVAAVGSAV